MKASFAALLLLTSAAAAEPIANVGIAARKEAVASTRGLAASTGITVPAGHVEVTLQALVPHAAILSVNAGITTSTELWVDQGGTRTFHPYGRDVTERTYATGLKQVIGRTTYVSIALTGSLRASAPRDGYRAFGLAATACVDPACGLAVSATAQVLRGYVDWWPEGTTTNNSFLLTAGASIGGARHRLLVDLVSLNGKPATVLLGMRFGVGPLAFDLGLASAVDQETKRILPWIGVTSRM